MFHIGHLRRWLSIFFLGVVPLSTARPAVFCEKCHSHLRLESEEQQKLAEQVADRFDAVEDTPSEENIDEYEAARQQFISAVRQPVTREQKSDTNADRDSLFAD